MARSIRSELALCLALAVLLFATMTPARELQQLIPVSPSPPASPSPPVILADEDGDGADGDGADGDGAGCTLFCTLFDAAKANSTSPDPCAVLGMMSNSEATMCEATVVPENDADEGTEFDIFENDAGESEIGEADGDADDCIATCKAPAVAPATGTVDVPCCVPIPSPTTTTTP